MEKTLAKLLKEKNLLVSKINEHKERIARENVTTDGNTSKYDLNAEFDNLTDTIKELVKVKSAISRLNNKVVDKIYTMSELKSQIQFLRGLSTKEGTERSGGGVWRQEPIAIVYKAHFDNLFVDKEVARLTEQISELQEELDEYNHTTKINL